MRKQNVLHRLVDEDNSHRMYLLLWIFLASIVIGLIWQAAELILYGEIQGRAVDDIIALAYAVAMIVAYYLGRDDEKELIMHPGSVDSKIDFQFDPATQKLILRVSLKFYNHGIVTVTIPLGKKEAELLRGYTSLYIEFTETLEKEMADITASAK